MTRREYGRAGIFRGDDIIHLLFHVSNHTDPNTRNSVCTPSQDITQSGSLSPRFRGPNPTFSSWSSPANLSFSRCFAFTSLGKFCFKNLISDSSIFPTDQQTSVYGDTRISLQYNFFPAQRTLGLFLALKNDEASDAKDMGAGNTHWHQLARHKTRKCLDGRL